MEPMKSTTVVLCGAIVTILISLVIGWFTMYALRTGGDEVKKLEASIETEKIAHTAEITELTDEKKNLNEAFQKISAVIAEIEAGKDDIQSSEPSVAPYLESLKIHKDFTKRVEEIKELLNKNKEMRNALSQQP